MSTAIEVGSLFASTDSHLYRVTALAETGVVLRVVTPGFADTELFRRYKELEVNYTRVYGTWSKLVEHIVKEYA